MEDEERAQREAYLHEELESLKISVAHLTSLLKQTLRNTSGEFLLINQSPLIRLLLQFSLRKE